ncbi:MAG TPA: hypothetical protein VE396_12735 [Xanthobacteraceae bacterium]|nr:hypothetical protein [Xanthobacteraceae bacterium]
MGDPASPLKPCVIEALRHRSFMIAPEPIVGKPLFRAKSAAQTGTKTGVKTNWAEATDARWKREMHRGCGVMEESRVR